MTPHCHRHTWDIAEATCRACKLSFCEACLVYSGRSEKPICVPCALATAGIRTSRQPRMSRKQRRLLVQQYEAAAAQPPADVVHEQQAQVWATMDASRLDLGTV